MGGCFYRLFLYLSHVFMYFPGLLSLFSLASYYMCILVTGTRECLWLTIPCLGTPKQNQSFYHPYPYLPRANFILIVEELPNAIAVWVFLMKGNKCNNEVGWKALTTKLVLIVDFTTSFSQKLLFIWC